MNTAGDDTQGDVKARPRKLLEVNRSVFFRARLLHCADKIENRSQKGKPMSGK